MICFIKLYTKNLLWNSSWY